MNVRSHDGPSARWQRAGLLATLCLVFGLVPAAADGASWVVLSRPLEPQVDDRFALYVARGERGASEDTLASLGDVALQVLWNDGRIWMPADTDSNVDPQLPGLYLVGAAPARAGSRFSKSFVPVGRPADGDQIWRSRLGHRLELVPEVDPLAPRPDGRLPLRVFLEGKPLADALITALPYGGSLRDYRRATSNQIGEVTLELDRDGWWLVHVVHLAPGGTILGAALALPPPASD